MKLLLYRDIIVIDEGRDTRFRVPVRPLPFQSSHETTPFSHITPSQEQTGVRDVHVACLFPIPSVSDSIPSRPAVSVAEVSVNQSARRKEEAFSDVKNLQNVGETNIFVFLIHTNEVRLSRKSRSER